LKQGGFNQVRINAQLANIFANGPTPDLTVIDPLLSSLQAAYFRLPPSLGELAVHNLLA